MAKNDQPDLDLIQMVQRARLQHDSQTKPSEVAAVYWLECKCENAQPPTPRAGQWLLNVSVDQADATWDAIKTATLNGDLGYKSKISTASRSGESDTRAVVVCTYDADDADDVARVRSGLSALDPGADWRYERG